LFEPVEAVPAVAHHLAGLADVAELLGQFQQPSLHSDDLLFLGHIMISVPPAGGPRFRPWGENRDPPSGSASETNNDRQIKFELIQIIRIFYRPGNPHSGHSSRSMKPWGQKASADTPAQVAVSTTQPFSSRTLSKGGINSPSVPC